MITSVSSKGQIVLPAEFRKQDAIEPGQQFEIERLEEGKYVLQRKSKAPNEGVLDLLLACPVKDWFVPLDRSETTDDIALPRF